MFNKQSFAKNEYMLNGSFKRKGYDWWWHSFTAINKKTGEEKPFYIEFFIINPGLSKDKVILGQNEENKKNKLRPSYLMVNVGAWGDNHKQLHRFYPLNEVEITKRPIEIKTKECYLSETRTYGEVNVINPAKDTMSDEGMMKWDLTIKKDIAWNVGYGTSSLFRTLKAFEMYWHAQGMKSYFEGTITFDDEEYTVNKETSYGYADKNWGSDFTSPWVWLSSCHLIRKETGEELHNAVFDVGGGAPKVFGIRLSRKLLGGYFIEGDCIEMNFSKFLSNPCKTTFNSKEDEEKIYWEVIQSNKKHKVEVHVECLKKDMLNINYEAPSGEKKHNRLWNGGNGKGTLKVYKKHKKEYLLLEDLIMDHVGCEYGEFDK